MRHLRSILYALVLAPAVWILAGVGLTRDLTTRGRDDFAVESATGFLLLLLAGAAYGILVFAPISPAGPSLAGLALLGIAGWALASPSGYAGAWPAEVVKESFDLSRPGYGLAALLAVPLIFTALSVRRWQRYEPPVLPIIGQLGRARGAAAAPGTPMAVLETAAMDISGVSGPSADAEPTQVLRRPAADAAEPAAADELAAALGESAVAANEPAAGEDEPGSAEAPADGDELTGQETTRSLKAPDPDRTRVLPLSRPAPAAPAEAPAEITHSLRAPDPETTRVLRAAGQETTRDRSPADEDTSPEVTAPDAERTRDLSDRRADPEQTEAVRLPAVDPAEQTQDLRSAAGEQTRALKLPRAGSVGGDQTQVIRAPGPRNGDGRAMTVANTERPPDEIAEDTTRIDIPTQRRPIAES